MAHEVVAMKRIEIVSRTRFFVLLASVLMLGGFDRPTFAQNVAEAASFGQQADEPAADAAEEAVDGQVPAPLDAAAQPSEGPESPQADAQAQADQGEQPDGSDNADDPIDDTRDAGSPAQEPPGGSGQATSPTTSPPSQPTTTEPANTPTSTQEPAQLPAGQTSSTADAQTPPTTGLNPWLVLAIVVALFVVPIWFGGYCAKRLRMPDHGWRISLAVGLISAAAVIIATTWPPRGGPDLVGGITLIYEVEDRSRLEPLSGQADDTFDVPGEGRVDMTKLIGALVERINPAGTKEVTLREYGAGQVEIIVPKAGTDELEQLKDTITNLGKLEFRIVANELDPEHKRIIDEANKLENFEKDVVIDQKVVARWVPYDKIEFKDVGEPDPALDSGREMPKRIGKDRTGKDIAETLVLLDRHNVVGDYLETTWAGRDTSGRPAVNFRFDATGENLFARLTGENVPNPSTGRHKFLGILLNNTLRSAPSIRQKIQGVGIIEGSFTEQEVESLVNVLNAGSLPAALNPTPLSEQVISPTIGASTVRQGSIAIVVSLILVVLFMLFYYRFAGLVACIALVCNLVLILGTMMLLKADFTLPGLAGLVLTIGMSVDANVLIFERMREELARGAALRMAIRNGFDKALSAIYDSNITTILTGMILFWIGTDQIKGFATTLIIGIIMSVYSAVYLSRIIFDVAEKQGWIKDVKMRQIIGSTNIDFLRLQVPAIAASCVLIAIGLVAVFQRGSDMLDIDFTGGVSASMVLREDAPLTQGEVRDALEGTELGNRNLVVVEQTEVGDIAAARQRKYMVYARVDDSEVTETNQDGTRMTAVEYVQHVVQRTFGDDLQTYSVDVRDVKQRSDTDAGAFAGGTEATLVFGTQDLPQPVAHTTVDERLRRIVRSTHPDREVPLAVLHPGHVVGSAERFPEWTVHLGLPADAAQRVLTQFQSELGASPIFPLANRIGGKVAGDMQKLAALAIFFSLLCIVGYLWLRFQQVSFGVAAVIALVHDVLVTIGMLAVSAWIVNYASPVASALLIEPFQISLQIVAALLTIVGYSVNDTIVIFDRIREVRGKSPALTGEMINTSVNQTLGRTILTSLTVLIVVVVLYFFGGAGIHAFAFSLVVGVLAGCYSTVFIASPALLWMNRPPKT
jgi:SecD/SecF fusion protein